MPKTKTSPAAFPPALSDNLRAVISLALFVHLFIVVVCLAANLFPSALEQQLLRVFQPYVQTLNLDLDGTRYYLTHATDRDVDHRVEVLPESATGNTDGPWLLLQRGVRGSERYHRYQRFADTMVFVGENDDATSLLAEGVARHYMLQEGMPLSELRCRRHSLMSFEDAADNGELAVDPDGPGYFSVVYRAQVLADERGQIGILKRENAALEAAVKSAGGAP